MTDTFDRLKAALADRYAIERELGSGGMATVYLVEDLKHQRHVALKVLRPELAATLGADRFLREIEIAARLTHPHVLPLYDSGEADGFLFYVMPYVEGESLRDRLDREKQLPLDDALQIARDVADALAYAHSHDVVHRDIKPENILLSGGHAVIADFGIARAITAAGGDRITETGIAVGTPAYLSPEQATGRQQVDARSDIYNLGCVLYEMLSGHPPFMGMTAQEVIARHSMDRVPPLKAARPSVPDSVDQAITKALAKTPADRFPTASQFADALAPDRAIVAEPALRRSIQRQRLLTAVVVVIAVAGGLWMLLNARSAPSIDRLAVLPLDNLTGDPAQAHLVQGIHEALITNLAKISALTVTSRRSVMRYAETSQSVAKIGRELNVGAVVGGSVQRAGDRLVVTVQLIEAEQDRHLWTETYEGDFKDVLSLQNRVTRAIAQEIHAKLSPREELLLASERPPVNPEAHEAYLIGRMHYWRGTEEDLAKSIEHFERAIAVDSTHALAYSGLANAYIRAAHRNIRPGLAYPSAIAAARKALELDSTMAEAAAALADSKGHYGWDWPEVERGFHRALELNPGDPTTHWWYAGGYLVPMGRFDEALAHIQRAQEHEPLATGLVAYQSLINRWARRYDEAMDVARQAIQMNPDDPSGVRALAFAFFGKEMYAEAAEQFERVVEGQVTPASISALAQAYAKAGRERDARALLKRLMELSKERFVAPWEIALVHTALGDIEEAFAWLEEAYAIKDGFMIWFDIEPLLDPLRSDARFQDLRRRMNFP